MGRLSKRMIKQNPKRNPITNSVRGQERRVDWPHTVAVSSTPSVACPRYDMWVILPGIALRSAPAAEASAFCAEDPRQRLARAAASGSMGYRNMQPILAYSPFPFCQRPVYVSWKNRAFIDQACVDLQEICAGIEHLAGVFC